MQKLNSCLDSFQFCTFNIVAGRLVIGGTWKAIIELFETRLSDVTLPSAPADFFGAPQKLNVLKRSPLFLASPYSLFGARRPLELFVSQIFSRRLNAKLSEIFTVFRYKNSKFGTFFSLSLHKN